VSDPPYMIGPTDRPARWGRKAGHASAHRPQVTARLPSRQSVLAVLSLVFAMIAAPGDAIAHPIVQPATSPGGMTERYTIAVPSEKPLATVRLEVQFPRGLLVTELEAPPSWRLTAEKTSTGQILGAVWDGGSVPAGQFAAFGVLAQDPTTRPSWSGALSRRMRMAARSNGMALRVPSSRLCGRGFRLPLRSA
jgi:uncharacterized protein YcnI